MAQGFTNKNKITASNSGGSAWADITGKPSTFSPSSHSHAISDTTGLQAALDAKLNSYILVATLANDLTTGANTTLNNVSGLVFTYAANSIYRIDLIGAVTAAAATTGNGFAFDLSSAVTSIWFQHFHQLANAGTLSGGSSIADAAAVGVSSGIPTLNVVTPFAGFGLLRTGANTGTCQLQFRSETTAAAVLKAGTTIVVEKIG